MEENLVPLSPSGPPDGMISPSALHEGIERQKPPSRKSRLWGSLMKKAWRSKGYEQVRGEPAPLCEAAEDGDIGAQERDAADVDEHMDENPLTFTRQSRSRLWNAMKKVWTQRSSRQGQREHGHPSESEPMTSSEDLDAREGDHVTPSLPPRPSRWAKIKTVSTRYEQIRSAVKRQQQRGRRGLRHLWAQAEDWVFSALVGVLTACSGALIEVGTTRLSDLRFGYCRKGFLQSRDACCGGAQFVDVARGQCSADAPGGGEDEGQWVEWGWPLLAYVSVGVSFAVLAALGVQWFAPSARGSGIPEVKTILGGFVLPDVVAPRTLAVKIVGLILAVSSGMSLGKEGPLVHVACCWGDLVARSSPHYRGSELKRRELLSAAAAAGVSTAFGAPLGGILFSLEEVSTFFPTPTLLKAFLAAAVAAVSLQTLNPSGGSGKVTMFEFRYDEPVAVYEYVPLLLLGVLGGLVGALLVSLNLRVARWRKTEWYAQRVGPVREVAAAALVTLVTSYPLVFTRPLSVHVIHEVFNHCPQASMDAYADMCDGSARIAALLVLAAAIRLFQTTITFGAGLPAGVFVPSLFVGACLGRAFGLATAWVDRHVWHIARDRGPVLGVYAMVGAASVLGGVCRVTISLVVIMFELTSSLQCVVPFMLAVLAAKATGDMLGHGLYDCYIVLGGYPFLNEEHASDVDFSRRASDVMERRLTVISLAEENTLHSLRSMVRRLHVGGFPLVTSRDKMLLVGYVHAGDIEQFAQAAEEQNWPLSSTRVTFSAFHPRKTSRHDQTSTHVPCPCPDLQLGRRMSSGLSMDGTMPELRVDMSKVVDDAVIQMVPDAPLEQLHNLFRQLGCRLVFLVCRGRLEGLVTKKQFLLALQRGDIGGRARAAPPPAQRKDTELKTQPTVTSPQSPSPSSASIVGHTPAGSGHVPTLLSSFPTSPPGE